MGYFGGGSGGAKSLPEYAEERKAHALLERDLICAWIDHPRAAEIVDHYLGGTARLVGSWLSSPVADAATKLAYERIQRLSWYLTVPYRGAASTRQEASTTWKNAVAPWTA